ncbi:hypothetical protein [Pantoea sp. BAV 3049]|uniref:COG4648 family protein n=1 Tax=Pantoea sp. BAV 3049 TaxID=2654188 RepID=UPI001E32E03D|nr:hypothetical protein [Pantoea sp. BAV 3049]
MQGVSALLMLAWPFVVWLAVSHPSWRWLLPLVAVLFILRLMALGGRKGALSLVGKWLAVAGVALSLASWLLSNHQLLMWYPVVVNGLMLALFGGSLFSAMPLVERLARLREPELPPRGVIWTRRVTQVWCLFFIFNGSIALVTCLINNLLWWTWWNGLVSYLLMGLLMAGEWLLRQRMRKQA